MTIEKNMQGTTMIMKVIGWLDTRTAPVLDQEVNNLDDSVTDLVLDFSELEYISSAGLRTTVAAYKKMNGNMTLRNVSDEIMGIIKMTGIDRRMKFE